MVMLYQDDPNLERRRQLAQAMMARGQNAGPIQHWTQGADRIANSLLGAYKNKTANREATQNREKFQSEFGEALQTGDMQELARVLADNGQQGMAAKILMDMQKQQSSPGGGIGKYNPRDYTVDSWSKFVRNRDPSVLERYESQRNVEIGGVPHVFDPSMGKYVPAYVGGSQGSPADLGGEQEAPRAPVTARDVGESEAEIEARKAAAKKGMRIDESGRMVQIEGSPEQRTQERTKREAKKILDRRVPGVLRDITRARELSPNAGPVAGAYAKPGEGAGRVARATAAMSPAYELNQHLESIKSNISIEELQSMREASPTGGALGQVPVRQQEFLMQIQGSLNPELSPEVLNENLALVNNNYMDMYLNAVYGDEQEWEQAIADGRATPQEAEQNLREKEALRQEYMLDTGFDRFGRRAERGGDNKEITLPNGVKVKRVD